MLRRHPALDPVGQQRVFADSGFPYKDLANKKGWSFSSGRKRTRLPPRKLYKLAGTVRRQ